MQQFIVPQFIDNEDHVIGPITTRQFLIFLGAGFIIFLAYRLLYFVAFLVVAIVVLVIAAIFAFYRPNGRPFHFFLLNLLQTVQRPALRVWKKEATSQELQHDLHEAKVATPTTVAPRKAIPMSRLAELSLVVDTGGVYRGEDVNTQT